MTRQMAMLWPRLARLVANRLLLVAKLYPPEVTVGTSMNGCVNLSGSPNLDSNSHLLHPSSILMSS